MDNEPNIVPQSSDADEIMPVNRNCTEHKEAPSNSDNNNPGTQETSNRPHKTDPSNIRIKLKYINDDLKQVSGHLQESLGEFKRY